MNLRIRFSEHLLVALLSHVVFFVCSIPESETNGLEEKGYVEYASFNVSVCINNPKRILAMECSSGHMVRLVRIFYGRSQQGRCGFTEDDCTMDLPNSENYPCIGESSCRIDLTSEAVGRTIPKCGQVSTYAQALYQCIPDSANVNMCEMKFDTSQQGFLRTPNYPHQDYPSGLDCNFTIVAPFEDQRIGLYAIDFHLEANGTGCSDWIELFDGYKSITLCGQRSRVWLLNTTHHSLHIRFNSNQRLSQKGFWLYFYAFPFRPPTTTTTTTPTISPISFPSSATITSPSSSLESTTSNLTSTSAAELDEPVIILNATDGEHVASFPTEILIGVVIGLIIAALAVVCLIFALKGFLCTRRSMPPGEYRANIDTKNNIEKEKQAMTRAAENKMLSYGGDTKRNRTPQSAKRPLRNLSSQNYLNNRIVANNNLMNV